MRRARRGRLEGASRQIVNAQDRREGVQTVEWLVCLDRGGRSVIQGYSGSSLNPVRIYNLTLVF